MIHRSQVLEERSEVGRPSRLEIHNPVVVLMTVSKALQTPLPDQTDDGYPSLCCTPLLSIVKTNINVIG